MPDQPQQTPLPVPTVNPSAQAAVNLIEDLVDMGEKAAEAAIIAQVPVMGAPVLQQIWETVFDWLVKLVMKPVAMLGGRVVISVEEYAALKKAASAQATLDAVKKVGTPDEISKASSDLDKAVAGAIQYVGGTHS